MSSVRDALLQQLGITQYYLRRPQVLQGEINVAVPAYVRLLIVTDAPFAYADPLMTDVLKSMMLSVEQTVIITPDKRVMLSENLLCPCWYLGVEAPEQTASLMLVSPSLDNLYRSAGARKAFWQQICQHENYFFTDQRRS